MKSKLKCKLIEEYIKIYRIAHLNIDNNLDKNLVDNLKIKSNQLLSVYETTFLRLGMLNSSFIHMKKELEIATQTNHSVLSDENIFNDIISTINTLSFEIASKLTKLSINQLEQNFILNRV